MLVSERTTQKSILLVWFHAWRPTHKGWDSRGKVEMLKVIQSSRILVLLLLQGKYIVENVMQGESGFVKVKYI